MRLHRLILVWFVMAQAALVGAGAIGLPRASGPDEQSGEPRRAATGGGHELKSRCCCCMDEDSDGGCDASGCGCEIEESPTAPSRPAPTNTVQVLTLKDVLRLIGAGQVSAVIESDAVEAIRGPGLAPRTPARRGTAQAWLCIRTT